MGKSEPAEGGVAAVTAPAEAPAAGLGKNRNWRWLFAGQAISIVGDYVFMITVLLWIATKIGAGRSWAPAATSGALIAAAVPAIVTAPIAGVWVDRWDRRRVMLVADAARCVLIACLLLIPALGHAIPVGGELAFLYVVLVATSVLGEFFDPSRLAILREIVPADEDQPKASGRLQASSALAQVIGPPIAAPLLITFGVQWAVILNAASFAVSFLCVRAIRPPAEPERPERQSFGVEFRAGISFFARSRVLVALGVGLTLTVMGTGALDSLFVYFLPANLHVSASWLGTLAGAVGIGAVGGAIVTGMIAAKAGPRRLFWIGLLVCGVMIVVMSRSSMLWLALAVGVVIGVAAGTVNTVFEPIILSVTPPRMIGRVNAVLSPLAGIASVVSIALAGTLASTALHGLHASVAGLTFGPYDTIFGFAGLLIVLAGLASIRPMRATAPADAEEPAAEAGESPAETLPA